MESAGGCSQDYEIMLQEYGPMILGTSGCTSFRIILALSSQNTAPKLNSVNVNSEDMYYVYSEKSGGRGAPGLFS